MRTNLLIAACVAVLAGAYFASRALTDDVPVPPVATQAPQVQEPRGFAPSAPSMPVPVEGKRAVRLQERPQPQPVAPQALTPPAMAPAVDPNALPPVESESPFRGESKELEYVEKLLADRGSDATKVRSAYDVLSRCLKQEPDNERCQDDMETARMRLKSLGAEITDPRGVVNPKLVNELPLQQLRKQQ